mmetsp:Transcript_8051/g.49712  ORF Transcript_8051/g.49712 Transcript_8051/m.49712 type:complete len:276 (-) Transcript_8051:288-1115(-)
MLSASQCVASLPMIVGRSKLASNSQILSSSKLTSMLGPSLYPKVATGNFTSTVMTNENLDSSRAASCGKYGRRRMTGSPFPLSRRANAFSHMRTAPVFAAILPRFCSTPWSFRRASPPAKMIACPFLHFLSSSAQLLANSPASVSEISNGAGSSYTLQVTSLHSSQDRSCGRMSVATFPPLTSSAYLVCLTASTASAAASPIPSLLVTHLEKVLAMALMSISSGASAPLCHVAMSPTMTTTGTRALLALCRLAEPLASPGPKWSSTAAGTRFILA